MCHLQQRKQSYSLDCLHRMVIMTIQLFLHPAITINELESNFHCESPLVCVGASPFFCFVFPLAFKLGLISKH